MGLCTQRGVMYMYIIDKYTSYNTPCLVVFSFKVLVIKAPGWSLLSVIWQSLLSSESSRNVIAVAQCCEQYLDPLAGVFWQPNNFKAYLNMLRCNIYMFPFFYLTFTLLIFSIIYWFELPVVTCTTHYVTIVSYYFFTFNCPRGVHCNLL